MGAMALFGEKYGDEVRVVRYGTSIELCGGTHISNTGRIGAFRILTESSIAAGVRRIEAITGEQVEEFTDALVDNMVEIKELLNNSPKLVEALHRMIDENKDYKKQVEGFMAEKAAMVKETVKQRAEVRNGITILSLNASLLPADAVKNIAFQLRGEMGDNFLFVAGTEFDGKPLLTVMLGADLTNRGLNAGALVRQAATHIQGNGGGQAHFAVAGGKDVQGLAAAIQAVIDAVTC